MILNLNILWLSRASVVGLFARSIPTNLSSKVGRLTFATRFPSPSSSFSTSVMSSSQMFSGFTYAITRECPSSFAEQCIKMDPSQSIQISQAADQLKKYSQVLQKCGLEVITLPSDEAYPDCVFVEDTAFIIGNKACITNPGHPSRKGEVDAIRKELEFLELEVCELDDPAACLDGGDILFTGHEIFVGESRRSNEAAVKCLQKIFQDFPVISIPVSDASALHLKSVATLAQEGVILISNSKAGQEILKHIQSKAHFQYKFLQVENDKSANIVYVNGYAIIKSESEIGSTDFKTLTEGLTVPWIVTEFDEFYKADGCLTCCSLLIQKNKDL